MVAVATVVTPPPEIRQPGGRPPVRLSIPRVIPRRGIAGAGLALGAVVIAAGIVARFLAPSGLWLDEALSVNIAKLPLGQMPGALVQDGSPPLYYLLLHFWMLLFGQGDFAVRALSGVFSVATLPFVWLAGKRVGDRRTAWAALLLAASSPWAVYYGSYTRMYSLMAFEAVLTLLALHRALEVPSRGRLVCVGALTAALVYTHYWDLYLVGMAALWVLWWAWSETVRGKLAPGGYPGAARRVFLAMVGGGALFLPWAQVFVFQALHTGTPWSVPPGPADLLRVFGYFAGVGPWAGLLDFVLFGLVALGLFAHAGPRAASVVLELRAQPRARFPGFLLVGTLAVAVAVGAVTGAAFDQRYIAVVFPLFILICALGLTTFHSRKVTAGVLAIACTAGLLSAKQWDSQPRTQAVQIAADLNAKAQPGDMVVYCPDQLGPAVDRLLNVPDVTELTYPRLMGPQRIDWVDYLSTIRDTSPQARALQIRNKLNPGSTLFLVWRNGYEGFGGSCGSLATWLEWYIPGGETIRPANPAYYEYENLVEFPS